MVTPAVKKRERFFTFRVCRICFVTFYLRHALKVIEVQYLEDNFFYIVLEVSLEFVLVDPDDFEAVHEAVDSLLIPREGV